MPRTKSNKILVSVGEAVDILSIGRSTLLALTYQGKLLSLKVGRRRLFFLEGLIEWARAKAIDRSASEQTEEFLADVENALQEDRDDLNG
jgi:excisionase family DNA binding protein